MEFIDTVDTLGLMGGGNDEREAEKNLNRVNAECESLVAAGWVKVPDWFPIPLPGYGYKFPGMYYAYMKPKPRLRHRLKYWIQHNTRSKRKARRVIEKEFEDLAEMTGEDSREPERGKNE